MLKEIGLFVCERIFFLNCIFFWMHYYPMNYLTHDVLQCRHKCIVKSHWGCSVSIWNQQIVLIRENMEQFICSNIPTAPAYGLYISQLIRYSRECGSYQDFLDRVLMLTRKLLVKLKSSLRKLYDRHHDLIDHYGISVSQMTTDMFHL
jgi:hypothetical protein